MTKEEILYKSKKIKEKLFDLNEFKNSNNVLFYVSKEKEVQTKEMIEESLKEKKIFVPISDKNERNILISEIKDMSELEEGNFGILEPKKEFVRLINPEDVDLVIVPGIAFDRNGRRVGYGFGYYDNFLKNVKEKKIALVYGFQLVDEIPQGEKDVKMDMIVTEDGVIGCVG